VPRLAARVMYSHVYMKRKQLYLDESTDRALKRLAARTGRSEAWHVREALRRYVDDAQPEDDPLERLIGLVDDPEGPTDVAENHDHYLYGAPKEVD
jgi:predicted transcriptional regulator